LKVANPSFIRSLKAIRVSAEVVGLVCWGGSVGRGETSRQALIVRRSLESTKGVHGNEAAGRDSNVARGCGEGGISVSIACGLESWWWHCTPIQGRGERLREDTLVTTSCLRNSIRRLFSWLRTSLALRCPAYTYRTWADTAGCLEAEGWTGKGGRINGRHPDSGLVNFEQVGNEGVEIDIGVGEVVECELLPVPVKLLVYVISKCGKGLHTFGTLRQESPYEGRAL
jgi:hypothetical protein